MNRTMYKYNPEYVGDISGAGSLTSHQVDRINQNCVFTRGIYIHLPYITHVVRLDRI